MASLVLAFAHMLQEYEEPGGAAGPIAALLGGGMMLIWLIVALLAIAGMWKVFAKAGEPGWAAIIPIYNLVVMLKIAAKPIWWIVLFLLCWPIAAILVGIALAEKFGKGTGFGVGLGLLPFIFYPILGFGSAEYRP